MDICDRLRVLGRFLKEIWNSREEVLENGVPGIP